MLPHKRPKIGLIFTGGGIATKWEKNNPRVSDICNMNEWMIHIPETNLIAEIKPIELFSLSSYKINASHWVEIAAAIHKNIDTVDGFVIAHGLDTIVYSASAVSFLLKDLGKPVIFTGSRFPSNEKEANSVYANRKDIYKNTLGGIEAKSNLINSVQAATMDIGEVCILFGKKLLRANRATQEDLFGADIFSSGEIEPLGEVNFGLDLEAHRIKRDLNKKTKLRKAVESKVAYLRIHPNFNPDLIEVLIKAKYKGLVLEPYFVGEFPLEIYDVLRKAKKSGMALVSATSAFQGMVDFSLYAGAEIGEELDIISAFDMTVEASLVKLMIVLGETTNHDKVKKLMQQNWSGEILEK